MYRVIVFFHILGAMGFLMSHGASASVAFRLRRETEIERIKALLDVSGTAVIVMWISLLVLAVAGIVLGFMGRWWNRGWIWTSIGLLLAIGIVMGIFSGRHYHGLRKLVGLPYMEGSKDRPAEEPASHAEILALINDHKPMVLTVVGFGGIGVILWLMMFKPF
jgi:hypothetical protein